MKLLTGNSNKNLSLKISKFLKTKLVHSSIRKFCDGEIYLEVKEMVEAEKFEGQCIWGQDYLMTDRCKTKLDMLGREYGRPPVKE